MFLKVFICAFCSDFWSAHVAINLILVDWTQKAAFTHSVFTVFNWVFCQYKFPVFWLLQGYGVVLQYIWQMKMFSLWLASWFGIKRMHLSLIVSSVSHTKSERALAIRIKVTNPHLKWLYMIYVVMVVDTWRMLILQPLWAVRTYDCHFMHMLVLLVKSGK